MPGPTGIRVQVREELGASQNVHNPIASIAGAEAMMLALTTGDHTLWWVAIGIGAVVVLVVIVLLSLLTTFVDDIDGRVADAWETATRVAANTATTWALQQTGTITGDLRDEVQRHVDLLSGGRG
ncbi:MAG: hypothetical protein ACRDX8_01120 [Acidimicrobiales bacterium]